MINAKELQYEERKWERQKELLARKKKIDDEKREFRLSYIPKMSKSKLLVTYLFLNCTLIEIFTGYTTLKSFDLALITGNSPDLTPLNTLVATVVAEVIGFAVYALKAKAENTKGGIVYETAMRSIEEENSDVQG